MVEYAMVSDLNHAADVEVQTVRIAWRSSTGAYGKGACMPLRLAENLLKKANKESPGITHWLEPCGEVPEEAREPSAFSTLK